MILMRKSEYFVNLGKYYVNLLRLFHKNSVSRLFFKKVGYPNTLKCDEWMRC